MATYTTNLGLEKPGTNDNIDVNVLNDNYDLIDSGLIIGKKISKTIAANANTCRIDFDSSGLWLICASITGYNNCWVGTVYNSTNGAVTPSQINSLTGITTSTGTNYLNFNFTNTSNITIFIILIPIRGINYPDFH